MGPVELCERIREAVICFYDTLPLFHPGIKPLCPHHLQDFNYAAVEALWHALGAQRTMWRLGTLGNVGCFYYYLRRRGSDYVLDPTAGAFEGELDFSQGQPARFVATWPGRRAVEILIRADLADVEVLRDLPCGVCGGSGKTVGGRLVCPWCGGSGFEKFPK